MWWVWFTGNMFGEDGIETIRELLEVKGRLDALGSLSDDEGVESDGAISEDDQDKSDIQVNEHEEVWPYIMVTLSNYNIVR